MKNKKLFIFREGEKSEDRLLWKPRGHSNVYLFVNLPKSIKVSIKCNAIFKPLLQSKVFLEQNLKYSDT